METTPGTRSTSGDARCSKKQNDREAWELFLERKKAKNGKKTN